MKPKIIKTPTEHEAALQRLEAIFDANPGTPEGDEAELLTRLIEIYEEEMFPMDMPTPVEAIRFRMEQQGLKAKDLVPYIGSAGKVSDVLSGKRELSKTMIRNLVNGLGIPAEVLLQCQGAELKPAQDVAELRKFPLNEMMKRGWITFSGTLNQAKEQIEDLMAAFTGTLGQAALAPAFQRQHARGKAQDAGHALLAWKIRVMNLALAESLPPSTSGRWARISCRSWSGSATSNPAPNWPRSS